MTRPDLLVATAVLLLPLAACGKKGPPLAPLRSAPAAVTDVSARLAGSEMQLRFTLPMQNVSGPERLDLDQIEIYAITVGPGGIVPPTREFLTRKYLIKTIPVKPPPVEGEEVVEDAPATAPQKPEPPKDPRPAPGEAAIFEEALTEGQLTPVPGKPIVPPQGVPVVVPPVIHPPVTTRYYFVRGRSRHGVPGNPVRVALPLVAPPVPPSELKTTVTESTVTLEWTAPPAELDPVAFAVNEQAWKAVNAPPPPPEVAPAPSRRPPAVDQTAPAFDPMVVAPLTRLPGVALPARLLPVAPTFNVYAVADGRVEEKPLNSVPLAVPTFSAGVPVWDEERCFLVRTVRTYVNVSIESAAGGPACVTPIDTFAPAAPTGLRTVSVPGAINLIWDANKEPDLAGYVVLRGEAPGDTLQALTPAPIGETNYRDTTVKPGVQYVYAVVAVDKAAKPNMSPQSARQMEVAR